MPEVTPAFIEQGLILQEIRDNRLYRLPRAWRKVPPDSLIALNRIREAELYRPQYESFDAYCESEGIPAVLAPQVEQAARLCILEMRLREVRSRPRAYPMRAAARKDGELW